MDYNILKTSVKDELDIYKCDVCNSTNVRRLKKRLSNIDLVLEEIDRRIGHTLMRMPSSLEYEVEHPLRIHL